MNEPRRVEASGPDIETAIDNGLAKLGLTRETARFIIDEEVEPSRGLFGLGRREAVVRLTVYAVTPPPAKTAEPKEPKRKASKAPSRAAPRARRAQAAREKEAEEGEEAGEAPALTPVPPEEASEEVRVAVATLQELLEKMGISAEVTPYYAEAADEHETGPLVLQVTGRDLGVLIGRRGETLAALQYITRLIVSRELQRRTELVVDVEHYKARREKRLRDLALRMARQAAERERTVKLEPMAAYERRIIHLALRDRTDVYTQSVGEGENRRVTIIPVKNR